jgi:NADH-quinone oxidoreductase subunit J
MLLLFVSSYVLHKAALFAHGVYHTAVAALARFPSAVFNAVLPILTTFLSVGVAAMPNPVHNLLCLIAVFFSTVLLYLYIGAEFLAFIFLIVYVGAIAILFLFVIMLLQLKLQAFFATGLKPSVEKTVTLTAVVVGLGMFDRAASALVDFFAVSDSVAIKTIVGGCEEVVGFVNNRFADILMFSDVLYTYHASLFFELGLILLTALLGAIVLSSAVGVAEVPTPLNRGLTNPYPRSKLGASPLHSLDPVTAFAAAA